MSGVKAICVFCGAQNAVPETHLAMGAEFGRRLAERGITMVYGGGDCGVMGKAANAVLENRGKVIGVFPVSLRHIESEHRSLTEIVMVEDMHERKQTMFDRSDAVVVLPGGFGTLDETFEILTWKQLRFHDKPVVIFNHEGYWDPLVALMDNVMTNGFARRETRELYEVAGTMDAVFEALRK